MKKVIIIDENEKKNRKRFIENRLSFADDYIINIA